MRKSIRISLSFLMLIFLLAAAFISRFDFLFVRTEKVQEPGRTFVMAAGTDTGASTASDDKKGGALLLKSGSEYTMEDGVISGKNKVYGGAIFISSGATFTMTGGTIKACNATYGGAIYVQAGGTCIINGGKIQGNSATYGAGIYVEKDANITIENNQDVADDIASEEPEFGDDTILGSISTRVTLKTIMFGTYPQSYAGNDLNAKLEAWYTGQPIVKTYKVNRSTWSAYKYIDGNTYVRGSALSSLKYYKDGTETVYGQATWFKVEPIRWYILNYDEWKAGSAPMEIFSELVLTGDMAFNSSEEDGNIWAGSAIRTWCNETFYNDAFSAMDKKVINQKEVKNNVTDNYFYSKADGTGPTTYDWVYFPSYSEMRSGLFTSTAMRVASGSDFAIANGFYYVATEETNTYTTAHRNGAGSYWLRSAGSEDYYACYIYNDGGVQSTKQVNSLDFGVRPAMQLSIKP